MSLSFFPLPASLEHPLKFLQKPSNVLHESFQGFAPNLPTFFRKLWERHKKTGKGISSFPRPHPLHMVQFFNNDSISSSSVRKPLSTSKRFFTILQACNTVAWSFLPTTIPILLVEESVYFFERYMAICRT